MWFIEEVHAKAVQAVASGELKASDLAIMVAVFCHMNWQTGRAYVTANAIADELGMHPNTARSGIKRLRDQLLISRTMNRWTGEVYYLINPHLVSFGNDAKKGLLIKEFAESLEGAA